MKWWEQPNLEMTRSHYISLSDSREHHSYYVLEYNMTNYHGFWGLDIPENLTREGKGWVSQIDVCQRLKHSSLTLTKTQKIIDWIMIIPIFNPSNSTCMSSYPCAFAAASLSSLWFNICQPLGPAHTKVFPSSEAQSHVSPLPHHLPGIPSAHSTHHFLSS